MQFKLDGSVLDAFDKLDAIKKEYKSKFLATAKDEADTAAKLFLEAGKIGILDIESFHRASDSTLDSLGLLVLFAPDGKLLHKGTWGKIKEMDKTNIIIQALRTFWAWQFVDRFKAE